jgi:hypothetical protein
VEDFQAWIMRGEQMQDIPPPDDEALFAEYLLPKILTEATDVTVMRKVMKWVGDSQ